MSIISYNCILWSFYLHPVNVVGTFSFFDWLKYVIQKCFHEIKYIRNVRISFLLLIFTKGIGHVNAITLHDVCLHFNYFKCFYKKIFLYISENILHLNTHRPHIKPFLNICSSVLFFVVHSYWLKGYRITNIPKDAYSFFKMFLFKWRNVHMSHCNVFILTVKIFCEKE